MNLKKLAAVAAITMSLVGGAVAIPSAAMAGQITDPTLTEGGTTTGGGEVSTQGLNTCKVTYVNRPKKGCVSFTPGLPVCTERVKVVTCTRY